MAKKNKSFEETISRLEKIVDELESRSNWEGICHYGRILFERTRWLRDAERLANSLINTNKNEQLFEFLEENKDLIAQSTHLHILFCWSLYIQGALLFRQLFKSGFHEK